MREKKDYLLSLAVASFLKSSNADPFLKELNFDLAEDTKQVLYSTSVIYREKLFLEKGIDIYDNVNEYESLIEAIPKDSIETIKVANEAIEKIYKDFQLKDLYDAETFSEIYFNLNNQTQKELNKENKTNLLNENLRIWFSNSKVVDASGMQPLIVYHGTGADEFTTFNFDNFPIAYFAENKSYSDWFQKARGGEGIMFECYLRIVNPIDLSIFGVEDIKYNEFVSYLKLKYGYELPLSPMLQKGSEAKNGLKAWQYIRGGVEWLNLIKKDGYFDGIKYFENNPDDLDSNGNQNITPAWAVFNSEQIKSSRGNETFSYYSKDIRFEKGGNTETVENDI